MATCRANTRTFPGNSRCCRKTGTRHQQLGTPRSTCCRKHCCRGRLFSLHRSRFLPDQRPGGRQLSVSLHQTCEFWPLDVDIHRRLHLLWSFCGLSHTRYCILFIFWILQQRSNECSGRSGNACRGGNLLDLVSRFFLYEPLSCMELPQGRFATHDTRYGCRDAFCSSLQSLLAVCCHRRLT